MELDLVEVLDKYPHATKSEFMKSCSKIAKYKWAGAKRPLNEYQQFVSQHMHDISPEVSPQDRMRTIAAMWRETKN